MCFALFCTESTGSIVFCNSEPDKKASDEQRAELHTPRVAAKCLIPSRSRLEGVGGPHQRICVPAAVKHERCGRPTLCSKGPVISKYMRVVTIVQVSMMPLGGRLLILVNSASPRFY